MTLSSEPKPCLQGLKKTDFEIRSLNDEIRVDGLCVALVRQMFRHLTDNQLCSPEEASELCHGADYFLREFIIADRNENLFAIEPNRVRQFAGHWYIVRTMEPNMVELRNLLNGTAAFYRFLAEQGLVKAETAAGIAENCQNTDYYAKRIEDFWAVDKDGYQAWRQACPLDTPAD